MGVERYADALATLDQMRPDGTELSHSVHVARASALIGLKRYTEAIRPLRAYLSEKPDGPDAVSCRMELAIALAQTGRLQEAMHLYEDFADTQAQHELFLPSTSVLAEAAYNAEQWELAQRHGQIDLPAAGELRVGGDHAICDAARYKQKDG